MSARSGRYSKLSAVQEIQASGARASGAERVIRGGTDLERIVDEYIQALAAFRRYRVYQRAGVLVDVVQSATTEQDRERVVSTEGIDRIRPLPLPPRSRAAYDGRAVREVHGRGDVASRRARRKTLDQR